MKILVLSDSHGARENIIDAFEKEKPDAVIFLGDGLEDFLYARDFYMGGAETYVVRGNCDRLPVNEFYTSQAVTLGGVKFYITHGNKEGVYNNLELLYANAAVEHAQAALYGHTHFAAKDIINGITLINPGTVSEGYYLIINAENGNFSAEHLRI